MKSFRKYFVKHYTSIVLEISGRISIHSLIFITLFTPIFTFSNSNSELASEKNPKQYFFVVKGTVLSGIEDSDVILIPPVKTEDRIISKRATSKIDRRIICLKKIDVYKKTEDEKEQKNKPNFSSAPLQNPLSISKSGDKALAINTLLKYTFEKESPFLKSYSFDFLNILRHKLYYNFSKTIVVPNLLRSNDFARPPPPNPLKM